jgi:hypothetical protein
MTKPWSREEFENQLSQSMKTEMVDILGLQEQHIDKVMAQS